MSIHSVIRHVFHIEATNMKPDPVLSLYKANEALMEAHAALAASGNADAAACCKEAAIDVVKAISAAVRVRAEEVTS